MEIYQYKDYDDYVYWQIKTNKRKIDRIYVRESTLIKINKIQPFASTIICHGTRNGVELEYFKALYPKCHILGTEISDNATGYNMTVEWDFNKQNPEWLGKYDIVYSNSIDHSIDPRTTLETWSEQLSPIGRMYIEYSEQMSAKGGNAEDPLDATHEEMIGLIQKAGLYIVDIITENIRANGRVFICAKAAEPIATLLKVLKKI
jgi:hypothetical protein